MKYALLRLLLLSLTAALLLTGCTNGTDPDDTASTLPNGMPDASEQEIVAIYNGRSDYTIVVPEGDALAEQIATLLKTRIFRATRVTLPLITDSTEASTPEILIGNTNREAGKTINQSISGYADHYAGTVGDTIILTAGGETSYNSLIDMFLETCLQNNGLVVPSGWKSESFHEYLDLVKDGKSDYVIVVSKKSESDYDHATYLQNALRSLTGVRIPVVFDTTPVQEKEILVGITSRAESQATVGELTTELDYFIGIREEKLIINGKTGGALSRALEWLETNCLYKGETLGLLSTTEQLYRCTYEDFADIATLINCDREGERKTLSTLEIKTIYSPTDSWFYSHHQMIGCINGTLVAVWSLGRQNESDCGQRIAYATSTDFKTWSEPQILMDTMMGEHSEVVLSVQGIYNNGKQLVVYIGSYEYKKEALRENGTLRPVEDGIIREGSDINWYITTEDGVHWSEPATMERKGGAGNGPALMENGELFFCPGGLWGSYTNDTTGITWTGAGTGTIRIDRETAIEKGAETLCETSFYFRNGVMYLLGRTNTPNLWVQFSKDYGRTWSEPYKTDFTDSNSKFVFGRLPDGRYYYVGNPEPKSNRLPLVLAISEDGLNFDEQYILGNTPYTIKQDGMYKSGHYGYPNCYVGDDGYFYVIYSKGKETVEVCRFALSEIGIQASNP